MFYFEKLYRMGEINTIPSFLAKFSFKDFKDHVAEGNPGNRTMDGYELVNILVYKIVGSPLNTDEQLHNHL